jgi:uncharacterized protein involved in exopolysaccharide biosynthesis
MALDPMSAIDDSQAVSPRAAAAYLPGEVLSLADIVVVLWRRKLLIAAVTVACAILAAVGSLLLQKRYDAEVVFMAISEDASGGRGAGLSSLVSQFGGIASLAGLATSGNERKAESLAILQSESLTEEFIKKNNLLPVLYPKQWIAAEGKWKTTDPEKMPTPWKANQLFKKKIRNVNTDVKTGVTTLTISWKDPKVAARWANELVALANDNIRKRTIDEGERNVAYLNQQLQRSTVVAVQNSISSLLENEFKKIMLARGSTEYAFRVLDVAAAPEKASFPSLPLFGVLGAMAGLVGVVAFILAATSFGGTGAMQPNEANAR